MIIQTHRMIFSRYLWEQSRNLSSFFVTSWTSRRGYRHNLVVGNPVRLSPPPLRPRDRHRSVVHIFQQFTRRRTRSDLFRLFSPPIHSRFLRSRRSTAFSVRNKKYDLEWKITIESWEETGVWSLREKIRIRKPEPNTKSTCTEN